MTEQRKIGWRVAPVACLALLLSAGAQAKQPKRPALRSSFVPLVAPIPLPRPRPVIPLPAEVPTEPAGPSDCQLRMTPDVALIEPLRDFKPAGDGCGIDDPVKLTAIMSKDHARIAITPPATLRCTTAEALAHWVRDDLAPLAATLGAPLAAVANFDSYECRGRNRVAGAIISEHGKGNAIDIRALNLANGKGYELTDMAVDKAFREQLRVERLRAFHHRARAGSDGFHENHIHVDLAERRSGYRICQWAVRDASDLVPLPRERPAEAPPREP